MGKGYHTRNTKPFISGWLQVYANIMYKIFFRSETVHLLLRIILESFKLHLFTSSKRLILAMNISLCKHKSGQMLQAVEQSLTWMPESFDARFLVSINS